MLLSQFGRAALTAFARPGRALAGGEPSLLAEIWAYLVDRYFSINLYEYQFYYLNLSQSDGIFLRNLIIGVMFGIVAASAAAMYQKRTLGDLVRAIDREGCTCAEKAMTLEQLGLLRNTAIKADLRRGTSLRRVVRCVGEEQHEQALAEKRAALERAVALAEGTLTEAVADQPQESETAAQDADTANAPEGTAAPASAEPIDVEQAKQALKKWKSVPYHLDFETDRFYIPASLIYGAEAHYDKKGTNPLTFVFVLVLTVIMASLVCFFLPELLKMVDNFIGQLA